MKSNVNESIEYKLEMSQSILESIPGYVKGGGYEDVWYFENIHNRTVIIDFSDIRIMLIRHKDNDLVNNHDLYSIIKLVWISLIIRTTSSIDVYVPKLAGIKLFFEALLSSKERQVNKSNIKSILSYMLTYRHENGVLVRAPKIISNIAFTIKSNPIHIQQALLDNNLDFMSYGMSKNYFKKVLEELIPEITDSKLTYRDWWEGGSYDVLTLDHGRYYIEHCLTFFEENYVLAKSLSSVIKDRDDMAKTLQVNSSLLGDYLTLIMRGFTPLEIKKKWNKSSLGHIERIHAEANRRFDGYYKEALLEAKVLNDKFSTDFLKKYGVKLSKENIDRIKYVSWNLVHGNKNNLNSGSYSEISYAEIETELEILKEDISASNYQFPTDQEYLSLGLCSDKHKRSSNTYPRQLIKLVSASGITNVVALTGWRKSEFGFPLSSISKVDNLDKLDGHAFPARYFVNWYVYKTNGKTKIDREITFGIYVLAHRLSQLYRSLPDMPCLYETAGTNSNVYDSRHQMRRSVRLMWPNFVNNYREFKKFKSEAIIIKDGSYDYNIKSTYQKVVEELPRIEFYMMNNSSTDKKQWLVRYRNRTLKPEFIELLDRHLSAETKEWINSLPVDRLKNMQVTTYVSSLLVEGTIYPSVHGFRHMWAEAVYRRFDGDVGWMIRSQFKHISKAMWLAYIRDKDNRPSHDKIQMQVVSSLIKSYLVNKGAGYTGQTHKWLRRLFKMTSIITPGELSQLAEKFSSEEIVSIKANPWGYCMLRKRSYFKAQCAISGDPQRHNASPDLCLNCTHNLMQANNVDWTLMHASQHVEAIKNIDVPNIFQESSYELVKNIFHNTKTLDPGHDALPELKEAMEYYEERRSQGGA